MEKNRKYEKKITISTILNAIKRNIIQILISIVLFFCVAELYVGNFYTKTYQTSAQLSYSSTITGVVLNTIRNAFESVETVETVTENLKNKGVAHSNGAFISEKDILDNLIIPNSNNSQILTIDLINADSSILQPTLQEILEVGIKALAIVNPNFEKLHISSKPSTPKDVSNTKSILVIFTLSGLVIGIAIAFIGDIARDRIYEKEDFKGLNTKVFDLSIEKNKSNSVTIFKKKNTDVYNMNIVAESIINLQNNINIYSESSIIAVTEPRKSKYGGIVAKKIADVYAEQGKKVLVIDCNMYNPSLDKIYNEVSEFSLDDIKSKNELVAKSINDNLDLITSRNVFYPTEIIGSKEFEMYINSMKETYDHVVLCFPPIISHQDLLLIRNVVTATVLVTRRNQTNREDTFNAINILEDNNCQYVGCAYIK